MAAAGADPIELVTDAIVATVDPARGGQILHVSRPGQPNALFHARWASPLPAAPGRGYGSGALDWLSHYRGGWQVMFPNAGADTSIDGLPLPIHGEVSATAAASVDADRTRVTMTFPTRRRLRLERTVTLDRDRPVLRLTETAINDDDRPLVVAWGQHPAFLATEGAAIDVPAGPLVVDPDFDDPAADLAPGTTSTWPLAVGRHGAAIDLATVPAGPIERVAYLPERREGWAAIRDRAAGRGVAMAWDTVAWPHLWLWQQIGGGRLPFFGRARIVALEPVSVWPADGLAAAVERGQGRWLAAGERAEAWLTMTLFEAADRAVIGVDSDGAVWLDV